MKKSCCSYPKLPRAPGRSWVRCRLSPRTLSPEKWEKASRHRTEVEPERQSPSSLWGTASRVCVRLVTEEHATRRGRLESKGQIRKKRETRGSRSLQSPGSWKLSSLRSQKGQEQTRQQQVPIPSQHQAWSTKKTESERPPLCSHPFSREEPRPYPSPAHIHTQHS